MSKRRIAAVAAVGMLAIATGCDQATTAGHNWVITPDVELHRNTGKPLIRGTGQCGGIPGWGTWIARSAEYNAWTITQGQTLIATCYPGIPVGSWGIDERES